MEACAVQKIESLERTYLVEHDQHKLLVVVKGCGVIGRAETQVDTLAAVHVVAQ